ncbi:hypothetical protein DNTS_015083 [Danionella cerebrum]|uniref:C2H2-type domain-containing protein n=1 Tax=Danionella cerebrum TaxID=2873325 RepID=A0A553QQA4_9TELE|nr:hypothetical protein DNTS_015083 [Danionella translucida]
MNTADFQTQLSSILEIMAKTAVVEISKLFEENSLLLRLQISRCTEQNDFLQKRCRLLESQLKSARKPAGGSNGSPTAQQLKPSESEEKPSVEVFGKEWDVNLWRREESNSGEQEDHVDLDSSDSPENGDYSVNSRPENDGSRHLTGRGVSRAEGGFDQMSEDFTTYTVSSDEPAADEGMVSAEEQGATGLDLNILQIPRKKKHECYICGKNFEYLSLVQRHMRTHSAEKPYECPICGKRFGQKRYLIAHERTHSGVKPYVCSECGKSFSMKRSLNLHLHIHTGVKPLKLHQVSRFIEENESLKQRCRVLESELKSARKPTGETNGTRTPLSVSPSETENQPIIQGVFGKEWCVNLWRQQESNPGKQEDVDSSDSPGEPISLLEEAVEGNSEELLKNEDGSNNSRCEDDGCRRLSTGEVVQNGPWFPRIGDYAEDYSTYTVPSDEQDQPAADGIFLAEQQGATGLIQNIPQKPRRKKHECTVCGKIFDHLTRFQNHLRTHSGEKPFGCPVCGKWFGRKMYLIVHERTHSGEKPYVCLECGKSFSQKSSLNVHIRRHTGLKPYVCSKCGKGFAYQFMLNAHKCSVEQT